MKQWFTGAVLVIAVFGLTTGHVKADVNNFTVTNFTADYYLDNSDAQGSMRVKEQINVNFTDYNHGILRALPSSYHGQSLHIKIADITDSQGVAVPFSTYNQSGNLVLKIGDPFKTLTGDQSYKIDYTEQNVISFYKDHDELYWNVNGTQWNQLFDKVTVNLHVPAGFVNKLGQSVCYVGAQGSRASNCLITKTADGLTVTTTRVLEANETLTIVAAFGKNYFTAPTWNDWLRDHGLILAETLLPPVVFGGGAFLYWLKRGKDLKGRGTIIPEYDPPDNLSAAEVGVINAYKLSPRDISATIIDLAIRKYLKITETTQKNFIGSSEKYQFTLLNSDVSVLRPHEQAIMERLFADQVPGASVDLSVMKTSFYLTAQTLKASVPLQLTQAGYFFKSPTKVGNGLHIFGFSLIIGAFFVHSLASIGFVLAGAIVLLFATLMNRRTVKGVAAEDTIKGLKLYLQVAEADRLKMLQSANAAYAEPAAGPIKTVDLFEKLLPYAIVLGVEESWAKQFQDIYKTPPDWYGGNWSTFNAIYFVSALNSSVGAMSTSFSPPSSSGSSGFGGGGFSGGGGGGGGGGGW